MATSKAVKVLLRAIFAVPFLFVAQWCLKTMDPPTIVASAQPAITAGIIEYPGGKVPILDSFYGIKALDQVLRGGLPTFAPSTFGYDTISSWQMFQFMVDLTPVYAIWFIEASRPLNAWTPAYFPATFAMLGQLAGVGTVVPFFYFLCFVFGPSASDLANATRRHSHPANNALVLPLVTLFHTAIVFAMFASPEISARHYWTFAWQLSPIYIGIINMIATRLGWDKGSVVTARHVLLATSLISASVWVYTVLYAPHSIFTLFVPDLKPQTGLVLHMRKALQADQIGEVTGIFLWLAYSFVDFVLGGLHGTTLIVYVVTAPVIMLGAGPGATFALGWYVREGLLQAGNKLE